MILALVLSGCGGSQSQQAASSQAAAADSSLPAVTCLNINGPFYGVNFSLDSSGDISGNIFTGSDQVSVSSGTTYSSADGQVSIDIPQNAPASGLTAFGTLSLAANAIPSGTCSTSASIAGVLNATGNGFSGTVTFVVPGAADVVVSFQ